MSGAEGPLRIAVAGGSIAGLCSGLALGGAGELVTTPGEIAPALRRAFNASTPYLINVITDVQAEYPRTTTGV